MLTSFQQVLRQNNKSEFPYITAVIALPHWTYVTTNESYTYLDAKETTPVH